jgi:hypothetical protein
MNVELAVQAVLDRIEARKQRTPEWLREELARRREETPK